ncbi:hypothetical protein TNCV_3777771 [Trichonephila clavipes]|nr:hypothetical protein TNCV_3777771 [Trichonephila clavipes]
MESLYVEPLSCRSVRIGSYKVFPPNEKENVTVYMTPDSIKFYAPNSDLWCWKGKAVLFIYPEPAFAEEVRNLLSIDGTCLYTFDPLHKDLRSIFITFIISSLTQEQINFMHNHYLPIEKSRESTEQGCKRFMLMTAPVLSANFIRLCLSVLDPSIVFDEGTEVGVSVSPSAVKEVTVVSYRSKSRAGVLPITSVDIMRLSNGSTRKLIGVESSQMEKYAPSNQNIFHVHSLSTSWPAKKSKAKSLLLEGQKEVTPAHM